MVEPIKCTNGYCPIVVKGALFAGYFAHCDNCGKSAGIKRSQEEAMKEWNRWVEIGGFIQPAPADAGEVSK